MWNRQSELDALREQIARLREDSAVLERLLEQERELEETVAQRRAEWDMEYRDVERMERVSLSSVWASLRGTKEEDLLREKAEEQAARMKLQEAERQLEEVRAEFNARQERLRELPALERRYEALLEEKKAAYRESDPVLAAKLALIERRRLDETARRRELLEAREAGEQALGYIRSALESLDSAAGWSTWDMLGGGLVSDMMKYSRMDDAQRRMESAQSALRRYRAELADVAMEAGFELQSNGLTYAMDIFFDNIFSDWAVRDRIYNSLEQLEYVEDRVAQIQSRLELDLDETERTLNALEEEWKTLIANV